MTLSTRRVPLDAVWCRNALLDLLGRTDYTPGKPLPAVPLAEILAALTDNAVARGLCADDTTSRDLFDTRLMGALTPRPSQVRRQFFDLYAQSPQAATDWYYAFSCDTNYIRRDRIARDLRWQADTPYGTLAPCARRTRGTPGAWTTRPVRTTGSFP